MNAKDNFDIKSNKFRDIRSVILRAEYFDTFALPKSVNPAIFKSVYKDKFAR